MIERILNKLGLYTKKQWNMSLKKIGELRGEIFELKKLEKENKKLRDAVEDREFGISILSEDLEKLKKENGELRKEVEKLRLKVARSVKRRRR